MLGKFIVMMTDIAGYAGMLFLTGLIVAMSLLIRSISKIAEKQIDSNGKAHHEPAIDPVRLEEVLTNSVNNAMRLKEDRERKRKVRTLTPEDVEELTDEELADRLRSATAAEGSGE